MKLYSASIALTLSYAPAAAQTCDGVNGPFTLSDLTGACTYEKLLDEYARQVFDVPGATCAAGSNLTAKEDFDAKLMAAFPGSADAYEAGKNVCKAMYDTATVTPFNKAANKGYENGPEDLHFEQMFYNGLSDWQDEVETRYETEDGSPTSNLKEDAYTVNEFYKGEGSYSRVEWPNSLTNFKDETCASHAAMCCWPKDRQANDNNGNCATDTYAENCVDKDPADNTNLCFADLAKGNLTSNFDSDKGFMVFPENDHDGEGPIHCHGFAWANDEYDSISRYKANNLFYVSMYDHMHQRGYVKNIPGMPMCGCMEQMPVATRSDCTQVDLTEDWKLEFDGSNFRGTLEKVDIDFNACRGRGNKNNDLWAYAAQLYDEGRMTRHQFGTVGRVLTNDDDCFHATENEKAKKGYVTGYVHNADIWTKVAGRDDLKTGEPLGREAFKAAFFEQTLTPENPIMMRICPDCTDTHKKVFYRRLTAITNPDFDLLHNILYQTSDGGGDNKWGEDFSLHSTYDDAVSGDNPWNCRLIKDVSTFNYGAPFDGECSPSGVQTRNQYSRFNIFPGPRPNVAYYINKPQNTGVQDFTDSSNTRASGLTDVDIGNPRLAGNTFVNNGVYHMTGSGRDIWYTSDEFHYKSQPWEGDIDVKVHVTDFANPGGSSWAKAGIMLRSDNEADSTYAFMLLSYSQGISAQHRGSKGNGAGTTRGANNVESFKTSPPQKSAWLRMLKKMETVEFYYSDTGNDGDWTLHATNKFYFPDDSYRVGLAVTSRSTSYSAEATFANYTTEMYNFPTSAPSISSAPTPWQPMVNIGGPKKGGEYSVNGDVVTLKGSGTGIWGSSDSFSLYGERIQANANVTVEMYINEFYSYYDKSRGGIMIRDSDDANAANVFLGATGSRNGVTFQSRSVTGAKTNHHKTIYVKSPYRFYVKLHETAATGAVTAYYKYNAADEWIEIGSTTISLSGGPIVGRAIALGTDNSYSTESMQVKDYQMHLA